MSSWRIHSDTGRPIFLRGVLEGGANMRARIICEMGLV